MPVSTIIVLAIVCAMFAAFAITMAWAQLSIPNSTAPVRSNTDALHGSR